MDVTEFLKEQSVVNDEVDKLRVSILEDALYISRAMHTYFDLKGMDIVSDLLSDTKVEVFQPIAQLEFAIELLEEYYGVTTISKTPKHYQGKIDVIEFLNQEFNGNGIFDSLIFNIIKYTTRLGRKDAEQKEVQKIRVYFIRLMDYINKELGGIHDKRI